MARPSRTAALAAIALAGTIAALSLGGCGGAARTTGVGVNPADQSSPFDGAQIGERPPAPAIALTDQHGAAISLSRYRGSVVILSFVYSSCGATCVLVAQQIRGALDELAHPVAVLLVSAQPSADTPASVARFLSSVSLSGRAEYLSGPVSRLRPIWRAYRVTPPETDLAIFKRDAGALLIDARGRERVAYGLEQLAPEALAHDIRLLQRG